MATLVMAMFAVGSWRGAEAAALPISAPLAISGASTAATQVRYYGYHRGRSYHPYYRHRSYRHYYHPYYRRNYYHPYYRRHYYHPYYRRY
jgi:hypothetical protein